MPGLSGLLLCPAEWIWMPSIGFGRYLFLHMHIAQDKGKQEYFSFPGGKESNCPPPPPLNLEDALSYISVGTNIIFMCVMYISGGLNCIKLLLEKNSGYFNQNFLPMVKSMVNLCLPEFSDFTRLFSLVKVLCNRPLLLIHLLQTNAPPSIPPTLPSLSPLPSPPPPKKNNNKQTKADCGQKI